MLSFQLYFENNRILLIVAEGLITRNENISETMLQWENIMKMDGSETVGMWNEFISLEIR
jgi:hypothetical protein